MLSYKQFMAVQDYSTQSISFFMSHHSEWLDLTCEVVKVLKEYVSHVYRKKNVMFTALWIDRQIVNPLQKENSSLLLYECCL